MGLVGMITMTRKMLALMYRSIVWVSKCFSPVRWRFEKVWPWIGSIEGLITREQSFWLYAAARKLTPGATIVEIGSYKGRSTASLAYGCRGTTKRIFSIDTFTGNDTDFTGPGRERFFDEWKNNISDNGLSQYVTPVVGDSLVIGTKWRVPIDLLFIDGSHVYEEVLRDFDNFYPFLIKGGLVVMHDAGSHDGPTKVWRERNSLLKKKGFCSNMAFGRKR